MRSGAIRGRLLGAVRGLALLGLGGLLTACGGEGVESEGASDALGSQAAEPFVYDRPADYPRIAVGPMQYIPTTTGKRVGLRVTLPADGAGEPLPGPFPVVLVQSGYNIGIMSLLAATGGVLLGAPDPYLVRRGYAMVSADVIGTGISEGGWQLFGAEEQQGYGSVVDWVQAQPWSDGNVGVAGVSYMAITSLFTAQQRPQDVKAVFASVPSGDVMRGIVGSGGLLNGVFMGEWMTLTHLTSTQNVPLMLQQPALMADIMAATQGHLDHLDDYYLPLIEKAIHVIPNWRTTARSGGSVRPVSTLIAFRRPRSSWAR